MSVSENVPPIVPTHSLAGSSSASSLDWSLVFKLPQFPSVVNDQLERKNKDLLKAGKSRERAILIQALFDSITVHTWYLLHLHCVMHLISQWR